MGLDAVEVIMRVEETFEIEIGDEEATELVTVDDIYQCVLRKLGFQQPNRCLSSAAFYSARRALMEHFAIPRGNITPGTPVQNLLPVSGRRQQWQTLSESLGVALPALTRPQRVERAISTFFFMLWGAAFVAGITVSVQAAFAVFGCSFGALWLANKLTMPLAVEVQAPCATVGGLAKTMLRSQYDLYLPHKEQWDEAKVWETLRGAIADETALPIDTITPDAHLIYDLDLD